MDGHIVSFEVTWDKDVILTCMDSEHQQVTVKISHDDLGAIYFAEPDPDIPKVPQTPTRR